MGTQNHIMLEAHFSKSSLFKRIIDSIKDSASEANISCSSSSMRLTATNWPGTIKIIFYMINHGFDFYRCDRNIAIGLDLTMLSKMIKCAGSDDKITIKAQDSGDR